MDTYAIEVSGIHKRYGGVRALTNVSLKIRANEIHAIVGENGAGKSTLMKILSGAVIRDSGNIAIFGKPADITNPITSRALGIGIIYQEFSLAPDLTVAENIFLGDLNDGRSRLLVPFKDLFRKAKLILDRLGFSVDPHRLVGTLPVAYQQVVEIAKALSRDARILILDEPTAVLTDQETEKLFAVLSGLKAAGTSIIYISHRLEEVFRISDRISIMKDGELVTTRQTGDLDKNQVITHMTGREFATLFPKREKIEIGEEILRVENLAAQNGVHDITLKLHRGEILGLSGLIGSGRTEFARSLFGLDRVTHGDIYLKGQKTVIRSVDDAKRNRIGLIPEDRKRQGLTLNMSILNNMTMANIAGILRYALLIDRKRERARGEKFVDSLRIKVGGLDNPVSSLSGGNQQKVVVAKWLNTESEILIFDEPTRGVDVGAKYEIYQLMNSLAERGYGIILISSELAEVVGMSDRVAVFNEGTVAGELEGVAVTETEIMRLAIPVSNHHLGG
ncbi:Ribose import ATP-binding protein RbsA 3 [uncultured Pleomorphomonas sp.]|uniref:Ribose import ATP-binding protein RbsA 3 n=2 Tax=uncultured Pleomorphomonas sp. TaxID=442121 RepID=A0A212L9A3_9HYPH|nr:Ribose import ATP-binding protein RbsA 3 [uncultured Pleomorphomonas sp.]